MPQRGDDLKAKYTARELAREWTALGMDGAGRVIYHQKLIRDLAKMQIHQHARPKGKGLWFWTRDIERKAPQLYATWKDKRHSSAMSKIMRGEAA